MIGGAFGVNIAAVIFNYYSQTSLNQLQSKFHTTSTFESLGMIKYLPPMLQQEVRVAFLNSTNKVYILGKHHVLYIYIYIYINEIANSSKSGDSIRRWFFSIPCRQKHQDSNKTKNQIQNCKSIQKDKIIDLLQKCF
jgi:hypothetical protein